MSTPYGLRPLMLPLLRFEIESQLQSSKRCLKIRTFIIGTEPDVQPSKDQFMNAQGGTICQIDKALASHTKVSTLTRIVLTARCFLDGMISFVYQSEASKSYKIPHRDHLSQAHHQQSTDPRFLCLVLSCSQRWCSFRLQGRRSGQRIWRQ